MSLNHRGYLDGLVASLVEEVEEVGEGLRPQRVLQVGEGVDLLLSLFFLHCVHLHFLLCYLLPDCLLLALVEEAADFHLVQNLGLFPDHYPQLLILLPLMLDRCPFLLGNSHKSLCPWANGQSRYTLYNVC
jgi:hypothetical protein